MEFTVSILSNAREYLVKQGFQVLLTNLMHIFLYKDGIDSFYIVSAHASNCLVLSYLREKKR